MVLARLHGGKVDSTTDFAHRELVEIEKQLAADKERLGDRSEFGALFLDRNNLKRVGLAVLVCSGCINTGVLVINSTVQDSQWCRVLMTFDSRLRRHHIYIPWDLKPNCSDAIGSLADTRHGVQLHRRLLLRPSRPQTMPVSVMSMSR